MGFRAPNLLATAKVVAAGGIDLQALGRKDCEAARAELIELPGVGEKIANCVLLFAHGFQEAFPVDVWVRKALLKLYFPRRRPSETRLSNFTKTYFGPHSGYAQQYLFHYMRINSRKLTSQSARRGSQAQIHTDMASLGKAIAAGPQDEEAAMPDILAAQKRARARLRRT